MTRLWNDPADFADEMVAGFVAANERYVRRVSGGVVRRVAAPEGEVAVVIGGGSGHYPAFGGLVGRGLAHGAAMGNLFASPSTQQILSVARAAHRGGGIPLLLRQLRRRCPQLRRRTGDPARRGHRVREPSP